MTHNCCSLSHSQCSFVIRAHMHFPNRHGGDGQRVYVGVRGLLLVELGGRSAFQNAVYKKPQKLRLGLCVRRKGRRIKTHCN